MPLNPEPFDDEVPRWYDKALTELEEQLDTNQIDWEEYKRCVRELNRELNDANG